MAVIPEFGGQEDLGARDARGFDAAANFGFVLVDGRTVDVAVASEKCGVDGMFDFIGFGLLYNPPPRDNLSRLP